jgi:hypothetical protein
VNDDFLRHVQHNWPLALIATGLALYLAVVLTGGVFYTNQGSITRAAQPAQYWRWVRRFGVLVVVSVTVLVGSYVLGRQH